jgi:ribosomal-protein-alanine N-acetyltransferase
MTIRLWEDQDLPLIERAEQRCFSDPWSLAALTAAKENPFTHCYLIEENGQLQAYGCLFVLFEEAEVQNIAVDIPYQKQGIGRALIDFMHEKAKALGAEKCFLEVRVSNRAAIALYQKTGYEIYGERSKYYADGESAFVMRKTL